MFHVHDAIGALYSRGLKRHRSVLCVFRVVRPRCNVQHSSLVESCWRCHCCDHAIRAKSAQLVFQLHLLPVCGGLYANKPSFRASNFATLKFFFDRMAKRLNFLIFLAKTSRRKKKSSWIHIRKKRKSWKNYKHDSGTRPMWRPGSDISDGKQEAVSDNFIET